MDNKYSLDEIIKEKDIFESKCKENFNERLKLFVDLIKQKKKLDDEEIEYNKELKQYSQEYCYFSRNLERIANEQNKLYGKEDGFDEDFVFVTHFWGRIALFNHNGYKFILRKINGQGTSYMIFDYEYWMNDNEFKEKLEEIIL